MSLYGSKMYKLCARRLSSKPDHKTAKTKEQPEPAPIKTNNLRYTVCQERSQVYHKLDTSKTSIPPILSNELQELQPSMQRQVYKCPTEMPQNQAEPTEKIEAEKTMRLMRSTTYKNVTLPLKMSKLAKPFPDPVKVMPSHTVSDQDKAEQMLNDSKMQALYRKQ